MHRKEFIKITTLALFSSPLAACLSEKEVKRSFPIYVDSLAKIGHLLRDKGNLENQLPEVGEHYDTVIVGAGLAGLSAGYELAKSQKILIIDPEDRIGGTAKERRAQGVRMPTGAHYDLPYPNYYGAEALALLQELDIIYWDENSGLWEFKDSKFYINSPTNGVYLPNGTLFDVNNPKWKRFIEHVVSFEGVMILPTRLIQGKFHYLNEISFKDYLIENDLIDPEISELISYQMKDDYGGGIEEVSALAGIHYYACRPYYSKEVDYFSPPEGNAYFANRLANTLGGDALLLNSLVFDIKETDKNVEVSYISSINSSLHKVSAEKVIYAAPKHTLPYVTGSTAPTIEQAPWLVVNLVYEYKEGSLPENVFWHNDKLNDQGRLGFVAAERQAYDGVFKSSLTIYYCLQEKERASLLEIETRKEKFISELLMCLRNEYAIDIEEQILEAHIRVMGHAMPVPKAGYLLKDMNEYLFSKRIKYAGVDNHRLPLLFEAIDSGLIAAKEVNEMSINPFK